MRPACVRDEKGDEGARMGHFVAIAHQQAGTAPGGQGFGGQTAARGKAAAFETPLPDRGGKKGKEFFRSHGMARAVAPASVLGDTQAAGTWLRRGATTPVLKTGRRRGVMPLRRRQDTSISLRQGLTTGRLPSYRDRIALAGWTDAARPASPLPRNASAFRRTSRCRSCRRRRRKRRAALRDPA